MIAATPSSSSMPHAAATSPNPRCRVRSGMTAASRASSSASISAAVPRYRSETSFGLPSAQPISRRYQYGFPLITFLYKLAITLGHRLFSVRTQAGTPDHRRPEPIRAWLQPIKINLARKLGLVATNRAAPARIAAARWCQWDHQHPSTDLTTHQPVRGRLGRVE